MLQSAFQCRMPIANSQAIGQSWHREPHGRMDVMNLKATLIAGGLAAVLGAGAAFAQDSGNPPPPPPQALHAHHHHGHGVATVIEEEVSAGRLSQKEGTLIEQKIKEMKRERRAERQARREGMEGSYGQGNPPPPPQK